MAYMPRKPVWVGLRKNNNDNIGSNASDDTERERPLQNAVQPNQRQLQFSQLPFARDNSPERPSVNPTNQPRPPSVSPTKGRRLSALTNAFQLPTSTPVQPKNDYLQQQQLPKTSAVKTVAPSSGTPLRSVVPKPPVFSIQIPSNQSPKEPPKPTLAPTIQTPGVSLSTLGAAYRVPAPSIPEQPSASLEPPAVAPVTSSTGLSLSVISKHLQSALPQQQLQLPHHDSPAKPASRNSHYYRSSFASATSHPITDGTALLEPLGPLQFLPLPPHLLLSIFPAQLASISGQTSSGKTELLRRIAVEFAVPKYMGGRASNVFVLDLENRFGIGRLAGLLKERVEVGVQEFGLPDEQKREEKTKGESQQKKPSFARFLSEMRSSQKKQNMTFGGADDERQAEDVLRRLMSEETEVSLADRNTAEILQLEPQNFTPEQQIREIYFDALSRIHISTPESTLEAICTIRSLPDLFRSLAESDGNAKIGPPCVIVDALSSFANLERDTWQPPRSGSGAASAGFRTHSSNPDSPKQLTQELRTLSSTHPCFVFTSIQSFDYRKNRTVSANHTISLERAGQEADGVTVIRGKARIGTSSNVNGMATGNVEEIFVFRVSGVERLSGEWLVEASGE